MERWTAIGWEICIIFIEIVSCQEQISQLAVSEAVKQVGEQIGLALLDSLLQKGQEEVARQALQRQIELLEDINPPYAKLLKQIPPETIVSAALAQRQQSNGPLQDTGNPFLNVLAKNGIVAQGVTTGQQNSTQQIGNVFQAVLRNILQSVQPSVVQNSLLGPQVPQQEITNPLAPNANQLVIPQQSSGGILGAFAAQASNSPGGLSPLSQNLASLGRAPGTHGGSFLGSPIGASIPIAAPALGGAFGGALPAFKTLAPIEAPPDPFGANAGRNLGTLPDDFLFTTPAIPFVTSDQKEHAQKLTEEYETTAKRRKTTPEPATTSTDEYNEDDEESETQEHSDTEHTETSGIPESSGIDVSTASFTLSPSITAITSTQNALTRDQRRLNEINGRMHRILAYRKTELAQSKRPASTQFASKSPSENNLGIGVPIRLSSRQTETHQTLTGQTGLGTSNENGGAWRPLQAKNNNSPLSTFGTGLGQKKEQNAQFRGQINLPKRWSDGHEFSVDGSLTQNNNNDVFSGIEFLRRL